MGRSSWLEPVPGALLIYILVARIATLEHFATVNPGFRPIQPMSDMTTKKPPSSHLSTGVQRGKLVVESRFDLTVSQGLNMLDGECALVRWLLYYMVPRGETESLQRL